MRKHVVEEEDAEINMTPMLDIVFIMLIFFIVTTSFIKETGIDPQRPDAQTAVEKPRGNILIAISNTDKVWMEKGEVTLDQVRVKVERARLESPESSVVIIADEKSSSGMLVKVMDQVRLAGVANVSVAAEEKS